MEKKNGMHVSSGTKQAYYYKENLFYYENPVGLDIKKMFIKSFVPSITLYRAKTCRRSGNPKPKFQV